MRIASAFSQMMPIPGAVLHAHAPVCSELLSLLQACAAAFAAVASLAQLAEHALRKRMVVGSIPTRGLD